MAHTVTNRIPVRFGIDGSILSCEVESLGEDLYRVVDVPGFFELGYFSYRDVFRLRKADDGVFDLLEIAERGGWHMFDYVLPKNFAESNQLAAVLTQVTNARGVWVREMGGLLFILLPPDCIWDPTRELQAASKEIAG